MPETISIARAIVYNDGKILVLQNAADDEHVEARGKWEMPGGTIEDHDDHEKATVKREIKEETGLDIDCQYYLARADSRNVTLSNEHQDYRWIRPKEFQDMDWLNYAGYTIPMLEKLDEEELQS